VRGIHPLEIAAEGETCQDTGRKGPSKGHSPVLTLWGPLREGYGRPRKEKGRVKGEWVRVRGTSCGLQRGRTSEDTERERPTEGHLPSGDR
jgi:hypothetical protein